jgi:hypothetical protein
MERVERSVSDHERQVRERRRAEILETIPRWYSPAVHLVFPSAFGLAVCVGAALMIEGLRPIELLALPITILLAWGFEWRVHKDVLHARRPGLGLLYVQHELKHHVLYRYEDMAMRSMRELHLILMPAYAVVLVFAIDLPLAYGLYLLTSANTALLFLVAAMIFFLTYEWLHLAYHLPETSRVGRSAVISRLRELHRRHHDPALMKRWNFNVTLPLFDWIHGTMWSPERARTRAAARPARARVEG